MMRVGPVHGSRAVGESSCTPQRRTGRNPGTTARLPRRLARILKPGAIFLLMLPSLCIYRTDRNDEGWYPDVTGQPQWNFTRPTWNRHFAYAGLALWESEGPPVSAP